MLDTMKRLALALLLAGAATTVAIAQGGVQAAQALGSLAVA